MASIPLVGLASNDIVPGHYLAVNFAQGQSSSGITDYSAILIGNKSSAGSATDNTVVYGPDTPTPLSTEEDAIALFGVGSELHLMFREFVNVNQSTKVYAISTAVTGSSAAAAGTITFTNAATANASCEVTIMDQVVSFSIVSGDAAATIATACKDAINANVNLPVTAGSLAGAVTITAKIAGARGNFIKYSARIIGTGVATTVSPTTRTACSLGSGTNSDGHTAALATIANSRYYYQVSAAEDASLFGSLCTQVSANAQPIVGIRCRAFAGSVDTIGNVTTLATTINNPRAEVIWQPASDLPPALIAAKVVAAYALYEQGLGADRSLNFNGFGNDANSRGYWSIKAPLNGSTVSRANIKTALNVGVTPIAVSRPGSAYLVKRVTSYSLNGSNPDYRIRDAHKVTISDFFADDLVSTATNELSGKALMDTPTKGQRSPGTAVATPNTYRNIIFRLLDEYNQRDLLQNVDQIKQGTQVIREASPNTRISARIPLQTIDILDQTATNVNQIA